MFAWLLISDRLNTKDLLVRRHWKVTEDHTCVMCSARVYEDRQHLFFDCLFSQRVWNYLQITWESGEYMLQVASKAHDSFAKPFFSEVVFLACWHIWKLRNGKIFRKERPSFMAWHSNFVHDLTIHMHRFPKKLVTSVKVWLAGLP